MAENVPSDHDVLKHMQEGGNLREWLKTDHLANGLRISSSRHSGTKHFGPHFAFGHLPMHLQEVSRGFAKLAQSLVDNLMDGPELTTALRHLWDSKNSAVLHAGFITDKHNADLIENSKKMIN